MVKFYLDLDLTGESTALPTVPTVGVIGDISSAEIIGIHKAHINASTFGQCITFHTVASYDWGDVSGQLNFGDISFNYSANAEHFNTLQDEIDGTHTSNTVDDRVWYNNWYSAEGAHIVSNSHAVASDVTGETHGDITNQTTGPAEALANAIAESVFNSALAYDIFNNEESVYASCVTALSNMSSTISHHLQNNIGAHSEASGGSGGAKHVGERLMGQIFASEPGRFVDIGNTTSERNFSENQLLRAGDELHISVKSLKVTVAAGDHPLKTDQQIDVVLQQDNSSVSPNSATGEVAHRNMKIIIGLN
jgi:hypothetical protein